jgi:flagellar hook protein FlgE
MMASLFAGVSGLRNHQVKMNVIANNISNINTIGYKPGRVTFQEALVQTIKGAGRPSTIQGGTNPVQLGLGMQVGTIDTLFQQGGLELTGQVTDLALQGAGFFILGDSNGNRFYTRAGSFGFDGNSTMVDLSSGKYVLGKMADAAGNIPSIATIDRITLPFGQQDPARATETVWLANNLNVSATESVASLLSAGSSGATVVSGTAANGVGGTHTITITGNQALQSNYTGARTGLGLGTTLSSLGVTDFSDWTMTVDNTRVETISGLTGTSTIEDVLNTLNQIDGLSAVLTGTGEIEITRTKAGATTDYNFTSSASAAGNIVDQLFTFGSPAGSTALSAGGAATTYIATDNFMPSQGTGAAAGPFVTTLDLVFDEATGLVIGLDSLGGGDVEITAGGVGGLMATTPGNELIVQTADTTHSTSISVFDSLGERHTLAIEFFKSAVDNRWEWTASMLGNERVVSGGTGYVLFNSDGSMNTFAYTGNANDITIDTNTGAGLLNIAVDAGTIGDFDGLTGFASDTYTASFLRQDGYGLGVLEKIDIDQNGNIAGVFTNGINRVLAQIMLADFSNPAGLRRSGRSSYQVTANSGSAIEGFAGSTITGSISAGALESSAVDIAQEFTSMITAQRGFQANARIISTSDNMLDELVNIKR